MAHITYSDTKAGWPNRVFSGIGAFLTSFGRTLEISRHTESRLREIERLQAKSDGELANLGLSRDRIVHHVFRDIYYL
jgi:hypothetical protein